MSTGTDHRTEIGHETVKGLFWMNGGGAVALLAFLPEAWDKHPVLAWYLIVGLGFMAAGVVFAALVNPARHESSLAFAKLRERTGVAKLWFWVWRILVCVSVGAFIAGAGFVVIGVLCTLARESL
ncbi:MAG: hypothetical protein AB7V53_15755 [Dongiaceae bacterium]